MYFVLPGIVEFQQSWFNADDTILRYEDLLINDIQILEILLMDEFQLPISKTVLRRIIVKKDL